MIRALFTGSLATAALLASSRLALAASIMPPIDTVKGVRALTIGGKLQIGSYPLPAPVDPPASHPVVTLGNLTRRLLRRG